MPEQYLMMQRSSNELVVFTFAEFRQSQNDSKIDFYSNPPNDTKPTTSANHQHPTTIPTASVLEDHLQLAYE